MHTHLFAARAWSHVPSKYSAEIIILLLISPEAKEQSEMFPFSYATLYLLTVVPDSLFPKAGGSLSQGHPSNILSRDKKIPHFQQEGLLYSGLGTLGSSLHFVFLV